MKIVMSLPLDCLPGRMAGSSADRLTITNYQFLFSADICALIHKNERPSMAAADYAAS